MTKKLFSIICAILMIAVSIGGGAMATTIPSQVKNIVAFIFIKNTKGEIVPNGTGFFVGVKDTNDTNRSYVYLVTAKHVLQNKDKNYHPSIYIRLNTKKDGSKLIELQINTKDKKIIYTHEEPEVDIAVIPYLPKQEIFDFKILPEEFLTTKELFEKNQIQEGDEIFFTGLFTGHFGRHRNYPIVRFGRVAMLAEEKVEWEGEMMDLYLVETQSFGGNSGSPVFFYLGSTRKPGILNLGQPKLLLAGIMKGSFLKGAEIKMMETKNMPISFENVGIAAVVPAYKLHEILFSDELMTLRKMPKDLIDNKEKKK